MRWIVEGANPETGRELKREVEANTAETARAVANARGMLVSSVSPIVPECQNCGRKFGRLETPIEFGENVVCAECHKRLAPEMIGYESRKQIPPMANYAAGTRPCPCCGSRQMPQRKAKGSVVVMILLLCIGVLPGVLYAIFMNGYEYVCPGCGFKIGGAS